ncbi:MAG TPA: ABC-F family ATP-binding cassette domain-containing protein [Acidobacteriota bacterium]|nr:ABC-F family ATP-binding cassette domain-containing protein [Acidobacteriota bacterium]
MLFRFDDIGREFGGDWLFRDVTVQCNPGDRVGLIGRNGTGKTTLIELIEGRQNPDAGRVYRASGLSISRVAQIPQFAEDRTVRQEALQVFAHLHAMEVRMHELEGEMARISGPLPDALAAEYEGLRHRYRLEGGYDYQARTEAVLLGLGFAKVALDVPASHLSGGQQNRLLLAQALLRNADLLLLDEPTNHLDIQGILWLTEYLRQIKTSFVVISHDRRFLDQVTTRTWELEAGRLFDYPANFSRSRVLKQERVEFELKQYEKQQEWKAKTEEYIRRNIAGQKTKQAQSRLKKLEKTDWLARPHQDNREIKLRIAEAGRGGSLSLQIRDGQIGYDPARPLITGVNLTVRRGERLAFVGANGTGKTTLVKTLMGEVRLLGGTLEWGVNNYPAYFAQSREPDDPNATVYDRLRDLDPMCPDLEIRNLAARFLFQDDDVFKKVSQLSGGEQSRLALARLFFHPSNVLLLDEPTNHLDIQSREALEAALGSYEGTLIVISHDLYFLRNVVERFFLIQDGRLVEVQSIEELERLVEEREPPQPIRTEPERSAEESSKPSGPSKPRGGLSKNERLRRERRLHELESQITDLEAALRKIVDQLQQGYEDFTELSEQHQELDRNLAELYQEWEEVMAELGAEG